MIRESEYIISYLLDKDNWVWITFDFYYNTFYIERFNEDDFLYFNPEWASFSLTFYSL